MSVLTPIVATWDGENRRAYLAEGTSDYFPIEDLYHEYRNARKLDHELRKYNALLRAEGNIKKGGGAFTPRYVVLLEGFKIIPFNESLQLNQLGDIITDDPDTDATLYDISGLTVAKPIFIKPSNAETVQLNSESIVFSSFLGGVWYQATSPYSDIGSAAIPNGNRERPVNSVSLAIEIAITRGFDTLHILGNVIFDSDINLSTFKVVGQSPLSTTITINAIADVTDVEILDTSINGILDGGTIIRRSLINGLSYVTGFLSDCGLNIQPIVLGGNAQANLVNCFSNVPGALTPIIDMGGSGNSLAIRGYSGGIRIKNRTGIDSASIDMSSGHVIIDASCTGGPITIRGSYKLTVEAGATIPDTIGRTAMVSTTASKSDVFNATQI